MFPISAAKNNVPWNQSVTTGSLHQYFVLTVDEQVQGEVGTASSTHGEKGNACMIFWGKP
jgi:hypothetical protein